MSRIPIRLRLTAAFAAAMILVLAGAGLFVSLRLRADLDEKLALQLKHLAEDAVLKGQPYGDERCDNCLYYLNPDDKLAYCWHPKLRILVGDQWWCQWWEKAE